MFLIKFKYNKYPSMYLYLRWKINSNVFITCLGIFTQIKHNYIRVYILYIYIFLRVIVNKIIKYKKQFTFAITESGGI